LLGRIAGSHQEKVSGLPPGQWEPLEVHEELMIDHYFLGGTKGPLLPTKTSTVK
jgi:hypothetical protein